jgi:hypothetical protein
MSDSLATLTTRLQALMLDDGTLFNNAACEAAIRQALDMVNFNIPINAGATIEAVGGQYEYELTEAIAGAEPLEIIDVLLADRSGGEADTSLDFDSYIEDERWFFRLHSPQAGGDTLIVRFTQPHTINGLDGEVESTLPASTVPLLLDGAAAELCRMAAAARAEANNVDPNVPEHYTRAAQHFERAFRAGLLAVVARRPAPRSEPDRRAWNDPWADQPWKWN